MVLLSERGLLFARDEPAHSFRESPNFETNNRTNQVASKQHSPRKTTLRNDAVKMPRKQEPMNFD